MAKNDSQKAEINARISEIREYFCSGNNLIFSKKLGISAPRASNLCNTEPNVGKEAIERILDAFPQVSRVWLYLGEGPMLAQSVSGDIHDNNVGGDLLGHGATKTGGDEMTKRMMESIDTLTALCKQQSESVESLTALCKQQHEQIEQLIAYIQGKRK